MSKKYKSIVRKSKSIRRKSKRIRRKSKRKSKKYFDGMLIKYIDKLEPEYDSDRKTDNIYRKYVKKGVIGDNEMEIIKILKELYDGTRSSFNNEPYNKNLIVIKEIVDDKENNIRYYQTEVLDTYIKIKEENEEEKQKKLFNQIHKLNKTRRYLQNNGIAYIDWKIDNTGLSYDGEIKLFDFDFSGVFEKIKDITPKWILEPQSSFNYQFSQIIFNTYSCKK